MDEVTSRRISITVPLNGEFLQRQCPHCSTVFEVHAKEFDARGLLNLRCPACRLVSEAEACATNAQREYAEAIGHRELMKMAEERAVDIQEELGRMLDRAFRGNKMIKVTKGQARRPDLGGPPLPEALVAGPWQAQTCQACGFSFRVRDAAHLACPICR